MPKCGSPKRFQFFWLQSYINTLNLIYSLSKKSFIAANLMKKWSGGVPPPHPTARNRVNKKIKYAQLINFRCVIVISIRSQKIIIILFFMNIFLILRSCGSNEMPQTFLWRSVHAQACTRRKCVHAHFIACARVYVSNERPVVGYCYITCVDILSFRFFIACHTFIFD